MRGGGGGKNWNKFSFRHNVIILERSLLSALGPAHNLFGYNEDPAFMSRFLCTMLSLTPMLKKGPSVLSDFNAKFCPIPTDFYYELINKHGLHIMNYEGD